MKHRQKLLDLSSIKSNTNPKCITHLFYPNCASNYVFRRVRPRRVFCTRRPVITLEIITRRTSKFRPKSTNFAKYPTWVGDKWVGATKSCRCEVTRPSEDQVAKFLESEAVSNKQIQRSKKFYANGVPSGPVYCSASHEVWKFSAVRIFERNGHKAI
jgi:hypothetical protein